jgi:hypothetical protein
MAAPLIVSNAKIEIIAMNFMTRGSVPIVAKNVRAWCNFETIPGKIMAIFSAKQPESPSRLIAAGFTAVGR